MAARSAAQDIELVPVTSHLRERVLPLAPHPDQEVFSGRAEQMQPAAEADPRRHPYAIVEAGEPVGFFVVDEAPPAADPSADLCLRAFLVDRAAQGRGIAKAAVSMFVDTGELHLGGPAGPQHVLRLVVGNLIEPGAS